MGIADSVGNAVQLVFGGHYRTPNTRALDERFPDLEQVWRQFSLADDVARDGLLGARAGVGFRFADHALVSGRHVALSAPRIATYCAHTSLKIDQAAIDDMVSAQVLVPETVFGFTVYSMHPAAVDNVVRSMPELQESMISEVYLPPNSRILPS